MVTTRLKNKPMKDFLKRHLCHHLYFVEQCVLKRISIKSKDLSLNILSFHWLCDFLKTQLILKFGFFICNVDDGNCPVYLDRSL